MTRPRPRCLLLYIEPTPYITPLLAAIASDRDVEYVRWFVTVNASQEWGADGNVDGASIIRAPGSGRLRSAWRAIGLAAAICRGEFTAAHLAGWGHPLLFWAILWLRLAGVPFSMESDSQRPVNRRKWKESIKAAAYPRLFRWPRFVLPAGSRQAELFRSYGVPEQRIRVASMTVDVTAIVRMPLSTPVPEWRARWGIGADDVVFLFVGRLEPHKGITTLLEAFGRVARDPRARLVIVGEGTLSPERLGRDHAGVTWTGRQPFRDVVQWMRSSDVLVVPSTFEPWGLVVNEAMACGLPVIATERVGAVDDLVVGGKNGFVVPASDAQALASAMAEFAAERGRAATMGKISRDMIRSWTVEREANVIRDVVRTMVTAR